LQRRRGIPPRSRPRRVSIRGDSRRVYQPFICLFSDSIIFLPYIFSMLLTCGLRGRFCHEVEV
jgi:hypothetical protein